MNNSISMIKPLNFLVCGMNNGCIILFLMRCKGKKLQFFIVAYTKHKMPRALHTFIYYIGDI